MSSAARYRRPAAASNAGATSPASEQPEPGTPIKQVASESSTTPAGFSVLDVLRVLGGILLLTGGISYLSTSGESMTWGYNPWWTRAREWKALWKGQISLTDDQLLAYDGTDPSKPIYLALNGTIYDVSANPGTYGPGGSYHFFAGRDAARAFLTGCFMSDQTPDLRGVERMFLPIDPEEKHDASPEDKERAKHRPKLSKAELKNRHAQELRSARKSVKSGLEHWHVLFRGEKGKPYFKVGEVKREEGWLEKMERRELCEQAEKSRPVRKYE